jgi:tetratricopeptide (TPR) repeat protein
MIILDTGTEDIHMPIKVLSMDTALANRRSPVSKWPMDPQSQAGRLVPLAKPRFDPTFKIRRDELVFTVGSCFARNIEKQLAIEGFDFAARHFQIPESESDFLSPEVSGLLNKYVVHSVLNELRWALDPSTPFPDAALIAQKGDKWLDPHIHQAIAPSSLARVMNRRRYVTDYFRQAGQAGVFIMTLGLAEAWYDTTTGLYLNGMPPLSSKTSEPGRFEFHILDYAQILECLEDIHALLTRFGRPDLRFLVTVSPVVLGSTFSGEDVLIANTYSKSVQRAAVSAFAARHDNVNYFPSYESVTLSDRSRAWDTDQAHASDEIVRYNVLAMMGAYVDGEERGASADDPSPASRADAAAEAMELMSRAEAAEKAGRIEEAMSAYRLAAAAGPQEALVQLGYGRFLQRQGRIEEAIQAITVAARHGASTYGAYGNLASLLASAGRPQEAYEAVEQSLKVHPGKPGSLGLKARVCMTLGRHDEALATYEDAVVRCAKLGAINQRMAATADKMEEKYVAAAAACGQTQRAEKFLAEMKGLAPA